MANVLALGAVLACIHAAPSMALAQTVPSSAPVAPPAGVESVDRSARIARATVLVSTAGHVRARGVVLAPDGRVVTALAPLANETHVALRFPNGRTVSGVVVATDPTWGVALIQPQAGAWREALPLVDGARTHAGVRWSQGDEVHALGGTLRRRRTFVGPGNALLRDAWELDPPPPDTATGSGVANASAEIVAVLVPPAAHVASGGASSVFGVPASVVRELLTRAGATAAPWLGLVARNPRHEDADALSLRGLRVIEVTDNGPADRAGIRAGPPGDVILGTTERAIHSVDDLSHALQGLHPGDTLTLRVSRRGAMMDVPVRLGDLPPFGP